MKPWQAKTLLCAALASFALAASAQWAPTKPITIIVPWAAGGATDQVTRLAAAELEPALGQKVVVVNQPGGAGSIGTKNAMEAPKDGYTWTAGAAKQLGTYPLLGMLNSCSSGLTVVNIDNGFGAGVAAARIVTGRNR